LSPHAVTHTASSELDWLAHRPEAHPVPAVQTAPLAAPPVVPLMVTVPPASSPASSAVAGPPLLPPEPPEDPLPPPLEPDAPDPASRFVAHEGTA
jgi:hypothetical protein